MLTMAVLKSSLFFCTLFLKLSEHIILLTTTRLSGDSVHFTCRFPNGRLAGAESSWTCKTVEAQNVVVRDWVKAWENCAIPP